MSKNQFPYFIADIGLLEPTLQQAVLSITPASSIYKSILILPTFQPLWQRVGKPHQQLRMRLGRTPEWTLALTDDRLIVVTNEVATGSIEVTAIPLSSMIAFEWGTVLLDSWLDVVWSDGSIQHTHVEYNTVGENLVRSLFERLQRSVLARSTPGREHRTPLTEDQIKVLPMKFANMLLNHALLPGEQVYSYCFEPTLKSKWFRNRGRDGLLWAMTNYHSLFIREPRQAYPYGIVFTFCPRHEVRSARVTVTDDTAELHLTLSELAFEVKGVFPAARYADLMSEVTFLPNHLATA